MPRFQRSVEQPGAAREAVFIDSRHAACFGQQEIGDARPLAAAQSGRDLASQADYELAEVYVDANFKEGKLALKLAAS